MPNSPETGIDPSVMEGRPEVIPDTYSLLLKEELEKLRDLNIKNTAEGLSKEELDERNELEAKKRGERLKPLSIEERQAMLELQKNQATSNEWDGENAKALWLLQLRYEKKGVVDQADAEEEKIAT